MPPKTAASILSDARRYLFWTWEYVRRNPRYRQAFEQARNLPAPEIKPLEPRGLPDLTVQAWGRRKEELDSQFGKDYGVKFADPGEGLSGEEMLRRIDAGQTPWGDFEPLEVFEEPQATLPAGDIDPEIQIAAFQSMAYRIHAWAHEFSEDAGSPFFQVSEKAYNATLKYHLLDKIKGRKERVGSNDDLSRATGIWLVEIAPVPIDTAIDAYARLFPRQQREVDRNTWSVLRSRTRSCIEQCSLFPQP